MGGIRYNIGDIANNSRQLFQDPDFDEDGELIYPYIEDGIYAGFYDAGELNGTCAIGFDVEDDASITRALEQIKIYFGDCIHVLGGDYAEAGNDRGELSLVTQRYWKHMINKARRDSWARFGYFAIK